MPSLYIVTNEGQISTFQIIKDKTSIGRGKDNDVVLSDSTVSRHHCELTRVKAGYALSDLGSFNGTKVNRKRIQSLNLKHTDVIQIGLTKLTFFEHEKASDITADVLVFTTEGEPESDRQHIVNSSPVESHGDSKELLIMPRSIGKTIEKKHERDPANEEIEPQADSSNLSQSNKVLFVLYEISRHMNQIHDFKELLDKIMELILMVIDADYGFLVISGGDDGKELIPMVVKHKTDPGKGQSTIKASRTLIKKVIDSKVALLTSDAMDDSRFDGARSVMIQKIRSAICVPLWRREKILGVIQLDSLRLDSHFREDDLELLKAIGSQISLVLEQAALNEQIRAEEQLRNRLERFHSPQVIEMILTGGTKTKDDIMEPKELTATILFVDIVGFTQLSESMPPREINIILNRLFSRITDIVFAHDGTLDKYMGDGLMALFGAPMMKDDDAVRAIRAAIEIKQAVSEMAGDMNEDKKTDLRFGINTGPVVAGNIGSPKRMDYTVIGDPVNIASRLEAIAEPNQILIGENTYQCVKDQFKIQKVGPKKIKGKRTEITVYEILE